jgi:hypothetical protein
MHKSDSGRNGKWHGPFFGQFRRFSRVLMNLAAQTRVAAIIARRNCLVPAMALRRSLRPTDQ